MFKGFLFVVLLLLSLPIFAQNTVYTFLRGTVVDEKGVPVSTIPVIVTGGGQIFNLTTDANGLFVTVAPLGDVTVTIGDVVAQTVKLVDGEITEATFKYARPGIVMTINNFPDNAQMYPDCRALVDGVEKRVNPVDLGKGKYWYNETNATAIAIVMWGGKNDSKFFPNVFHRLYKFDKAEKTRQLTMDFPQPADISLKILDGDGKALPEDKTVSGTISTVMPANWYMDDWLNVTTPGAFTGRRSGQNKELKDLKVTNGTVIIPGLMPGVSFDLQLRNDGKAGPNTRLVVDFEGKTTLTQYQFTSNKVEQKIIGADGKPKANTMVNASYIMDGTAQIVTAKSDENGIIKWLGLPGGRLIVWGDGIQPQTFNTDNPTGISLPPRAEGYVNLTVPNLPAGTRLVWFIGLDYKPGTKLNYITSSLTTPVQFPTNYGVPITFYAITSETTPRVAAYSIFLPYQDLADKQFGSTLKLNIPLVNGGDGYIETLNNDKSPADVSRVEVTSDDPLINQLLANGKFVRMINSAGKIKIFSPIAGKYQVNVDLDNNSIAVTLPMKEKMTVKMKEMLFKAPGGSVVNCIFNKNSNEIITLSVTAEKIDVPVYGNPKDILGCWIQKSASSMLVWRPEYGNGNLKELKLRTVEMAVNGAINPDDIRIMSPFGAQAVLVNDNSLSSAIIGGTENTVQTYSAANKYNLWQTNYALNLSNNQFALFNVNDVKNGKLNVNIPDVAPVKMRTLNLKFSETNLTAPRGIIAVLDNNPNRMIYYTRDEANRCSLTIPEHTKTVRFMLPNCGITKDISVLPATTDIVTVPTSIPTGITYKAQLIDSKGNPMVSIPVTYCYMRYDTTLDINSFGFLAKTTTDEKGNITLENMLPGQYIILPTREWWDFWAKKIGWMVKIPDAAGEINAVLKANDITAEAPAKSDKVMAAWLPVGKDKAIMLPTLSRFVPSYGTGGNGTLLCFDLLTANAAVYPVSYQPDAGKFNAGTPLSSAITINLPLEKRNKYPQSLLIRGNGPWKDIFFRVKPTWRILSAFNIMTTSINLPAGKWTVVVLDDDSETTLELVAE
ncbi:MAG: carboxypeptidase-like regulatory domain-containing protein [bacterium]